MTLLPVDCQCEILSRMSPAGVGRLSAVSRDFKILANSDDVWSKFLPSDLDEILSRTRPTMHFFTKKYQFVYLIHGPLILHEGHLSLALDRRNAKKIYMVGARELDIKWVTNPNQWIRIPFRFGEVTIIQLLWCFEIKCKIETRMLSANTVYVAFLMYSFVIGSYGFMSIPIRVALKTIGERGDRNEMINAVYLRLDPSKPVPENGKIPQTGYYGWMEVELGDFFVDPDNNRKLQIRLCEKNRALFKSGLIVEGIEFRPKV